MATAVKTRTAVEITLTLSQEEAEQLLEYCSLDSDMRTAANFRLDNEAIYDVEDALEKALDLAT